MNEGIESFVTLFFLLFLSARNPGMLSARFPVLPCSTIYRYAESLYCILYSDFQFIKPWKPSASSGLVRRDAARHDSGRKNRTALYDCRIQQ